MDRAQFEQNTAGDLFLSKRKNKNPNRHSEKCVCWGSGMNAVKRKKIVPSHQVFNGPNF